jgi:hypothetical protein
MKEKIIKQDKTKTEVKETTEVKESAGIKESKATKEETVKVESQALIDQETLCSNISNLAGSFDGLSDIDAAFLDTAEQEMLHETRLNILHAIHYYSKYLQTED